MNVSSPQKILPIKTLAASLISLTALAFASASYAGDTRQVLSASIGTTSPEDQQLTVTSAGVDTSFNLENDGGGIYTLAWGLQDEKARFRFEYYYSSLDTAYNGAAGTREFQALYYSGYWTPTVYGPIKAIVGAGVGYGYEKLKDFSDGVDNKSFGGDGWLYKFTLGGEYQVAPRLGVYLSYELAHQHDFDDDYMQGDDRVSRELEQAESSLLHLGVNYSF